MSGASIAIRRSLFAKIPLAEQRIANDEQRFSLIT
jgi:hypothetical protein